MKFQIDPDKIDWWYWAVTLVCLITGLASGYVSGDRAAVISLYGFYGAIGVSWIQVIHFSARTGTVSFPSQVRLAYALFVTVALFDPTRIFYWMLLLGTIMVTFFDRCVIARVLAHMPWNKGVQLRP